MNQSNHQLLKCRIEAPDAFVPKARYALESLLRPFSLAPGWVEGECDLYYGSSPDRADAAMALPLHTSTVEYFDGRLPYDPDRAFQAGELLSLFGEPDAPDLIASAFFFLSGWDEYTNTARDEHGRFTHQLSLQNRLGKTSVPLVDLYGQALPRRLFPAGKPWERRAWHGHSWAFIPTFDVDYLREWRPGTIATRGLRMPKELIRGLLTGQDAYRDGVHHLLAALSEYDATGTFFFKAGNRSAYDPAYRRKDREIQSLLEMVREQGSEIGLHPGYYASSHAGYLSLERAELTRLSGEAPRAVRQHYLRYELPRTSRLHVAEGFRIDSTLGFPDHEGFRRGTCLPFQIFDVDRNEVLDLWEMPLCYMDAAMIARRGLTAEESLSVLHGLMETVRARGGACVALWHNTLWQREMEGWPENLGSALEVAREQGAWIGGVEEALRGWERQSGDEAEAGT